MTVLNEAELDTDINFASNPDIFQTRSALRLLSLRETMQRAKALASRAGGSSVCACTGQIFIGLFFDGTGNNEKIDYLDVKDSLSKQKHSNVARLFHVHPHLISRGTSRFYSYYIPGVGTPFPEIGDVGGALGTGMSWNGEPRIIWGLTRIFNAVSDYVSKSQLIPDDLAGKLANKLGGVGSMEWRRNRELRNDWGEQLKRKIVSRAKSTPLPEQINLSVFGFSRGAAESRAFVNWLYQICDEIDGGYRFAGIPIRVDFLGIFDTVASVGLAGGFSNGLLGVEGRQSWASDNMQIHPGVESCVHIVAAHEVRATFPLDSVRVDGRYPPNVKEYVYPGAHSDVGGGYSVTAQGKTDALARIPGFEMYCAALAAGVPFLSYSELPGDAKRALAPSDLALEAFRAYMEKCKVSPAPVEEMARAHMAHYFSYRYQARRAPYCHPEAKQYYSRTFFKKTSEQEFLRDTQQHFVAILAAVVSAMKAAKNRGSAIDNYLSQPFQEGGVLALVGAGLGPIGGAVFGGSTIEARRALAISDAQDKGENDRSADGIEAKLKEWKEWLADNNYPVLRDEDAPERDILSVVELIREAPQPAAIFNFFDNWVHDSMAGLAHDGANEFLLNGIGLCKFRRTYFGNRGDAILREHVAENNKKLRDSAKHKRDQRKQWDLEAQEFRRTQS